MFANICQIEAAQFEKMFNNVVQDLLMVSYLSNLARTQVLLQERLLQEKCPQRERGLEA